MSKQRIADYFQEYNKSLNLSISGINNDNSRYRKDYAAVSYQKYLENDGNETSYNNIA